MNANEKELVELLEKVDDTAIDKALSQPKPDAGAALATPIPYCAQYCALRPVILRLLPFVRNVPFIGRKVAKIIELLMAIADAVCNCK